MYVANLISVTRSVCIWIINEILYFSDTSLNHNFTPATITSTAVKPETVQSKFTVDYDRVIENIKDLNVLAGEGVSKIQHTTDGARLRVKFGQAFIFFKNQISFISLTCVNHVTFVISELHDSVP